MAIARSTSRARAWKWSVAGGSVAAFLVMAQVFHAGDASRPSTPAQAGAAAGTYQLAGGATVVCVEGAYGYSCTPAASAGGAYGSDGGAYAGVSGTSGGGFAGAFTHTRSGGS